jgi:hypothetical protein
MFRFSEPTGPVMPSFPEYSLLLGDDGMAPEALPPSENDLRMHTDRNARRQDPAPHIPRGIVVE